jgi:hypothetical protein
MKQITDDYCSFETAKLLKEKGFDIPCRQAYFNGSLVDYTMYGFCDGELLDCPSQSLALKWLREVYNIYIEIRYMPGQFTDEPTYKAMIWNMDTEIGTPLSPDISYTYFETCIEEALKYTLENLI